MNLNIAINVDDNFIQHAMAMLCSLCENNKVHHIVVHVLTHQLNSYSKDELSSLLSKYGNEIKFYDVDDSVLDGVSYRKNRPLSVAAYYRLLLSETLPIDIEKVLYLDVDTIILKDVSELFSLELDDYPVAATLDSFPYTNQHRNQLSFSIHHLSFCSGVMMVNLKYWREKNVVGKLLEYAKRPKKEVHLHDQDVLNYLFKEKWFMLPPKWNRYANRNVCDRFFNYRPFDYKEYCIDPAIIHYASVTVKPWLDAKVPKKEYYLKYLKLSDYSNPNFTKVSLKKKIQLVYSTFKNSLGLFIRKHLKKF